MSIYISMQKRLFKKNYEIDNNEYFIRLLQHIDPVQINCIDNLQYYSTNKPTAFKNSRLLKTVEGTVMLNDYVNIIQRAVDCLNIYYIDNTKQIEFISEHFYDAVYRSKLIDLISDDHNKTFEHFEYRRSEELVDIFNNFDKAKTTFYINICALLVKYLSGEAKTIGVMSFYQSLKNVNWANIKEDIKYGDEAININYVIAHQYFPLEIAKEINRVLFEKYVSMLKDIEYSLLPDYNFKIYNKYFILPDNKMFSILSDFYFDKP